MPYYATIPRVCPPPVFPDGAETNRFDSTTTRNGELGVEHLTV